MEKKGFALTKFEVGALIVNVVAFVTTVLCFIDALYLPAMGGFIFSALSGMGLTILIYSSAAESLNDAVEDLEEARSQIERHNHIDDTLISVSSEKKKIELEVISKDEKLAELEKESLDKDRVIEELKTQLDFKNRELSDHTETALDERESLLRKSLLPNPEDAKAEMLNIIELANYAAAEISEFAAKAGIEIRFNCNDEKLLVKADKKRLHIMFKNILDNSVKYMGKSGQLIITISAVEDIIFIVLKDNGNGLATEEVAHIFELNYQGSNRISGNGLGLTQAKAIVEYYGGTIYAKSSLNSGMAIYIQLPAN